MAFLWGPSPAQAEFDTLLDKTTSDLLPSSTPVDLASSLELADLIRSAAVTPAHAVKSVLRRLSHDNPNVQLLALGVLDVLVKNGGTPFLVHLASSTDLVSKLELVANGSTGPTTNRDVRDRVRLKWQDWALAFHHRADLRGSLLVTKYDRAKLVGTIEFPPHDSAATAAMVDSLSAPEWQDSPYCTRCRTDFSTFNRKHHCRNCGQVFDHQCSSSTAALPHYGITEQVRVCDGCKRKINEGKGAEVARNVSVKSSSNKANEATAAATAKAGGGGTHARTKSRKEQEDEDLRRAIEASLAESSASAHGPLRSAESFVPSTRDPARSTSGYNPSYATSFGTDSKRSTTTGGGAGGKGEAEDDPDLAAAIAASLRDIAPRASAPTLSRDDSSAPMTYSSMFPSTPGQAPSSTPATRTRPVHKFSLPSYDLSPEEVSLVTSFTSRFSPMNPPPPYLVHSDRTTYENLSVPSAHGGGGLGERLERSLDDSRRRKQILRELEWKLSEAARLYGAGLTETASYRPPPQASHHAYLSSPTLSQPYAHPTHPQQAPAQAYPSDSRYQYHEPSPASIGFGQPLPYSIPVPASHLPPSRDQQQQRERDHHQPQGDSGIERRRATESEPVPERLDAASTRSVERAPPQAVGTTTTPNPVAGYYKPSQFPSVPASNPVSLPGVPETEPWTRERDEQERDRDEQAKVGELIEF
ncbi:hypothetical protein JCM10212_001078 [Sporobolomyces blumeae]